MSPHDFVDKRRSAQSHTHNVKAASKQAGSGAGHDDQEQPTIVSEDDYAALHKLYTDDDVAEADDGEDEQPEPPADDRAPGEVSASSDGQRYLRLAADFENHRRRTAQQLLDQQRYSSETAARTLLPVLDNLQRALDHAPDDEQAQGFVDGVRMAVRDFEAQLAGLGVVPIESLGTRFDPSRHEAIGSEESHDVDEETVIDELQRGWMLHDRVLRPAVVRIATPAKSG